MPKKDPILLIEDGKGIQSVKIQMAQFPDYKPLNEYETFTRNKDGSYNLNRTGKDNGYDGQTKFTEKEVLGIIKEKLDFDLKAEGAKQTFIKVHNSVTNKDTEIKNYDAAKQHVNSIHSHKDLSKVLEAIKGNVLEGVALGDNATKNLGLNNAPKNRELV